MRKEDTRLSNQEGRVRFPSGQGNEGAHQNALGGDAKEEGEIRTSQELPS